jgi:hypothetical protein
VADDIVLTPNMKLDVNGFPFGSVSGNLRVQRQLVDKTNTESTSPESKASPLRKATLQATAQRDPDAGYHTPGQLDFLNPDGFWLRIWCGAAGRADPANVIDIPTVLLSEEALSWNIANSAAAEVQLTGESSGDFYLAGE